MHNKSNVRLPDKFWNDAQNQEELKRLIVDYMKKNYPSYRILQVKGKFAICDIGR